MISPSKQSGAAIIVALFVVALVSIAATLMIERLRTDTRRTQLILNANMANLYAHGSLLWAVDQLNNNLKQKKPNQLVDKTPIQSPIDHQNNATIEGVITDAQGYFNINNLTEKTYVPNFVRLLQTVSPDININDAQNITMAIIDWISTNAKNAELDEYYLKSTPSYRAPHRPMASVSELRLVKGMTPRLYTLLSPYVIALPQVTPINVNSAAFPVMMCLSLNFTSDSAKAIVQAALSNPFVTNDKFLEFDIVKNVKDNEIASKITTTSSYFLVQTNVKLDQQQLTHYTLLERSIQTTDAKTVVLWQSKGTL